MPPPAGNGSSTPQTWSARLLGAFSGPSPGSGGSEERTDPSQILPPGQRKAAMTSLDALEMKLSFWALAVATVVSIAIPVYILAAHKVTKRGGRSITVGPDAILLYGAILVLCAIGFFALWKRKRTILCFDFFLVGFGLTVSLSVVGFVYIFFGAWLMLRAWRINKYGTTNAKVIAKEAAARPRGRERKEAAKASGRSPTTTGDRKPPTANKRYTPKAPPRKKIPKPTE